MTKPTLEVRVAADMWPAEDFALRAEGDNGMTFDGYAAVFNSPSEPLPFIERIRPGAFAMSLKETRNIKFFLNHNTDVVLGATRSGTLRLAEDDRGLRVTADLPDTSAGRDTATSIKRGDIDSMSFGFQVIRDEKSPKGQTRELIEVRLFEVSAVTGWPAYQATSAFVRGIAEATDEDPDALSDALMALRDTDAELTDEQYDLLLRTLNTRRGERAPLAPALAEWRGRLAEKLAV